MTGSFKLPLKLMNVTDKNVDKALSIIIAEKGATYVMLDPQTCKLNKESLNKIKQVGVTIIAPEKTATEYVKNSLPPYIPEEAPEELFEVIDMKNEL